MLTNRQKLMVGFTIIEMLVVTFLLGIISVVASGQFNAVIALRRSAQILGQESVNQAISDVFLTWAEQYNNGELPPEYTDGSFYSAVFDPTSTTPGNLNLASLLLRAGISAAQANDDGTAALNVRVYQVVSGQQISVPFFGMSGERALLTYDVGAIYTTRCPRTDTTCNPGPNGVPGESPVLDNTNASTWQPAGQDYAAVRFSTELIQRKNLKITAERINLLRDKLRAYFNALQLTGAANAATNYFPKPNEATAPNLQGQDPTVNDGCHDGWYNLAANAANSAAPVNVLKQIGLTQEEFGVTAWGGVVEFCRDYDPSATGTGTSNQPPHAAALRVLRNLSVGQAPSATATNNLLFSL